MISAGNPKRALPAHTIEADENVLDCKHRRVADVESSCNVWRGKDDGKRLGVLFRDALFDANIGIKKTALFPGAVDSIFRFSRIVGL